MADAPLPKSHPALIAWEAYKASDDYRNSFNWAAHEQHRDGSMWAAFWQGYESLQRENAELRVKVDGLCNAASTIETARADAAEALAEDLSRQLAELTNEDTAILEETLGALEGKHGDGWINITMQERRLFARLLRKAISARAALTGSGDGWRSIPDPDLMSMSNGIIHLHYENLDSAHAAFDLIESMIPAASAPAGGTE